MITFLWGLLIYLTIGGILWLYVRKALESGDRPLTNDDVKNLNDMGFTFVAVTCWLPCLIAVFTMGDKE